MSRLDLLTPAQRKVVTPLGTNFCVSSGAGCGKTRVLVERYIYFLEQDLRLPLERLAAITFTENAAAEMRDRIRRACRDRIEEARAAGDARLAQLWESRYRDVDIAPIDTIHGFCAGLLGRYPIEAGVDPGYSLLDEDEAALLGEDVVRATVEKLLEEDNADLLTVLEHFDLASARNVLSQIAQNRREVLERVVGPVMARSDDEVLAQVKRAADERVRRALTAITENPEVRRAVRTLEETSGRKEDKTEVQRAETLAGLGRLHRARTPKIASDAASSLVAGIDLRAGSAANWPSKGAFDAAKEALRTIRETFRNTLKKTVAFDDETERRHLALVRALYRTVGRVIQAYEEAKQDRSALDFADLQIRARDLLRSRRDVREACRRRFRAILVDELQDTNFLQFEIVRLLTCGPAGRAKEAPLREGALFAVGDTKQSIYRFRGAEMEVFEEARRRVEPAGRKRLEQSWRLHEGTAALVNHLFAPLMGERYEPIAGIHEQKNDAVGEFLIVLESQDKRLNTQTGHAEEARRLAARLEEIVRGESVSVYDGPQQSWRPARYGDIAILLRRTSYLHFYEQALENRALPYYVVAGRGFYKQQEVLDVLNLLRVLDDPSDDLHLAGILRSPFFAVSDEGLYRLRQLGGTLYEAVSGADAAAHLDAEDRRGLNRAARLLRHWVGEKDRLGLAALLDRVIFESGYAAATVGRFGGARAYANLRQMVELARRFERHGLYALGDYTDYVSDFMRNEMRQEQAAVEDPGGDTIRLMTIHKAKGLEFPVVVIPDLDQQPRAPRDPYFIDPTAGLAVRTRDDEGERITSSALGLARSRAEDAEREEAHRLLYVAMTRAKDYLILSTHKRYNSVSEDAWADILLKSLGVDLKAGESTAEIPSGHMIRVSVQPPQGEIVSRGRRRVGPRGILAAGRVRWDRLRERAATALQRRGSAVLERATPPDAPSPAPLRVTATALNTYHQCPLLYWWTQVLGIEECEPASWESGADLSPRDLGRIHHRALELVTSPAETAARAAVDGALREAALARGPARDRLGQTVSESVARFWAGKLGRQVARAALAYRETPFLVRLDETEVAGTIDLLFEGPDGRWELVDYKSGGPRTEKAADAAADYELQLGLYVLAASRWRGRPIDRWSVYFLDSAVSVGGPVSPADLKRTEAAAREVLKGIAARRFVPKGPGGCTRCRFRGLCDRQPLHARTDLHKGGKEP